MKYFHDYKYKYNGVEFFVYNEVNGRFAVDILDRNGEVLEGFFGLDNEEEAIDKAITVIKKLRKMRMSHHIELLRSCKYGTPGAYEPRAEGTIQVNYPNQSFVEYYRVTRPNKSKYGCTLREFKDWLKVSNGGVNVSVTGKHPYYTVE